MFDAMAASSKMNVGKKKQAKKHTAFRLPVDILNRLEKESMLINRSRAVVVEMALEQFFGRRKSG